MILKNRGGGRGVKQPVTDPSILEAAPMLENSYRVVNANPSPSQAPQLEALAGKPDLALAYREGADLI